MAKKGVRCGLKTSTDCFLKGTNCTRATGHTWRKLLPPKHRRKFVLMPIQSSSVVDELVHHYLLVLKTWIILGSSVVQAERTCTVVTMDRPDTKQVLRPNATANRPVPSATTTAASTMAAAAAPTTTTMVASILISSTTASLPAATTLAVL